LRNSNWKWPCLTDRYVAVHISWLGLTIRPFLSDVWTFVRCPRHILR